VCLISLREERFNMTKRILQVIVIIFVSLIIISALPINVNATSLPQPIEHQSEAIRNILYDENGIIIEDNANLLENIDINRIIESMEPISQHGKIAFVTDNTKNISTEAFARAKYEELFGDENGVIFLINMGNREIYIYSFGEIEKSITSTKAYSITDNVYSYASEQNYEQCAINAFNQINTVLEDKVLFTPLRYITGIFTGYGIALLIAILIVNIQRKQTFVYTDSTQGDRAYHLKIRVTSVGKTAKKKEYSSGDYSGDGSGSSSGDSFGGSSIGGSSYSGGGGGSSGGSGGGHRF
jgi:uncharacterized protein